MVKRIILTIIIVVGAEVNDGLAASDEEIKGVIVRALSACSGRVMDSDFEYAFRLCECESNHFTRVIRELAVTNDLRIARSMVSMLAKYGTTDDVEWLSQCIDVGRLPVESAAGILRLQGVCSNSIFAWARSVAWTNAAVSLGERLGYYYMDCATNTTVDVECQTMIKRELAHHAINHYFYNPWYDQKMTNVFPGYTYSFTRLQALSNGLERNTFYYNLNYITNALRELSEIPASEFHEFP